MSLGALSNGSFDHFGIRRRSQTAYGNPKKFSQDARSDISLRNQDDLALPYRLYNYVGPVQATTLFVGGLATSIALLWTLRGLFMKLPGKLNPAKQAKASPAHLLTDLVKEADEVQHQTAMTFTEGLTSVLMFAYKNPANREVQQGLKSYLGASILGYLSGTLADGMQEIWVRKEETQIRADLLRRLAGDFRSSIQWKTTLDNQLREKAKKRIIDILAQCQVEQPEALLKPGLDLGYDPLSRYPYEPVHLSKPVTSAGSYRFGQNKNPLFPTLTPPDPYYLKLAKGIIFGLGLIGGVLAQLLLMFVREAKSHQATEKGLNPKLNTVLYRIFNVSNKEALFFTGNTKVILAILGLAAAAKVGKILIDGYREIEVTRQNAQTELRYQAYNWLTLDPAFHRIAEEEALEDALRKFREAIPYEYNNRKALEKRIQTLLGNIGRNSAPKYFQMTPPVNLVAARS